MKLLKKISELLSQFRTKVFGRKYYIVIARNRFRLSEFCVGHIFTDWIEAHNFKASLQYDSTSDIGLEVHSFRSRRNLDVYRYNLNTYSNNG